MPYEKIIADLVQKQLFLEPKWGKKGTQKQLWQPNQPAFFEMVLNFMPTRVQVITFVKKKFVANAL